jgi:hypothetical protein
MSDLNEVISDQEFSLSDMVSIALVGLFQLAWMSIVVCVVWSVCRASH